MDSFQIDTSSKKACKQQQQSKLSPEDELVLRIVSDKQDDLEEHLNHYQLINDFSRFEKSLKKLNISSDYLFECLERKRKMIEDYHDPNHFLSQSNPLQEESKQEQLLPSSSNNYINSLPIELFSIVWQYLGLRDLYVCSQVQREWAHFFNAKYTSKKIKENCLNLWVKQLYQANKPFLQKFDSWRQMLKMRPFVRFDGFYVCKMMYRRSGLSLTTMNNPVLEVISYKYIRFYPDGSTLSIYTSSTPKRFLSKVAHLFGNDSQFMSAVAQEGEHVHDKMQQSLIQGFFRVHNDVLTIRQIIHATEYRYEFQMLRKTQMPDYKKDLGDHLDMYWAGFKVDSAEVEDEHHNDQSYIQLKINNYYDNIFKFKKINF